MIVPITGNVTYPITLDPTVWIFDDRKIELDNAFSTTPANVNDTAPIKNASERWDRELRRDMIKPPVNRSIKRFEREKILKSTYVMPIKPFLTTAAPHPEATEVILTLKDETITLPLDTIRHSYFLFAVDGRPLKTDGPVYLIYGDGSNKNEPIKHVKCIEVQ
ncbi:hypothetical protein [Lentibacillus saliphilus]|uniref:hypothetical protein n=1 Tax=Lentibacillus saliphilus TaxID=2737028 RepID=UPI001C2F2EBA|nr:hypothetical protein [Lentibacillus saliphilus]